MTFGLVFIACLALALVYGQLSSDQHAALMDVFSQTREGSWAVVLALPTLVSLQDAPPMRALHLIRAVRAQAQALCATELTSSSCEKKKIILIFFFFFGFLPIFHLDQ
jgi:hypothetical protein